MALNAAAPTWVDSPWLTLVRDLAPAVAALIALGAACVAFVIGRRQIAASSANLDQQLAAQAREARLDRQAQDARATRAERRDALVDAARAVQTVRHLAIRLHWMRMATRSPELSGQPYSSEDASTLSPDIDAARETIDFHLSVLTVIGLSDPAAALSELQDTFDSYCDSRDAPPGEVSEVTAGARATLSRFAAALPTAE
ncbi:hypothetical protein [Mycolicibacterium chlorophenolicum]|uniref:Uncharacterized protein n=1 Tax=Mycolicibacterium chlorophenolicum TaxID=37916 RepID=A0A0J6WIP1_9MYCO|nr:hypothetical protein [Mycolicibacterium chlorophenolicum]KMO82469.1 hypothetical protein MCHLDSM_01092 [Mycolicibacterium chlorophenolicum]